MEKKDGHKIQAAAVDWQENTPVSVDFDDVYFCPQKGLEESAYVFWGGNQLESLDPESLSPFTIAETGFGTGLNFLHTWQKWQQLYPSRSLTFISTEAFPLDFESLKQAHSAFPSLQEYASELQSVYPPPSAGLHLRQFKEGKITLILLYGDAATTLSSLNAQVNAWYLDGFAPSKNPEMWTAELFAQMARLSTAGATVATFTAAGFVRRGLIDAGFNVIKGKGFGHKRERIVGSFEGEKVKQPNVWWALPAVNKSPKTAIVIGAGFAGAQVARHLSDAGLDVTVVSSNDHRKSSGVPAATLVPQFQLADNPTAQFMVQAYGYAISRAELQAAQIGQSGILQLAKDAEQQDKLAKILPYLSWPTAWISACESGVFHPKSFTIEPAKYLEYLLGDLPQKSFAVGNISKSDTGWKVTAASGDAEEQSLESDLLIYCGGYTGLHLLPALAIDHPIIGNRGQVEIVQDNDTFAKLPFRGDLGVNFGKYISPPFQKNKDNIRVIGSSFTRQFGVNWDRVNTSDQQATIHQIAEKFGLDAGEIASCHQGSWTGVRATLPDHFPLAGPVPDFEKFSAVCAPLMKDATFPVNGKVPHHKGLYVLTGLGSKGLQYAPLCAAYITAMICDHPIPITDKQIKHMHPARFLAKALIKSNKKKA